MVEHSFNVSHGKRGATYSEILSTYTEYVVKNGQAIVVFDGYLSSTTKDMTHQRRLKSKLGATVTCTENMHLTMTKNEFLTNKANKQRFVNMLGEALEKKKCNCILLLRMLTCSLFKKQWNLPQKLTLYCVIMQLWTLTAFFQARTKEKYKESSNLEYTGRQKATMA